MAKFDKKLRAHKLRRQGESIKTIAELLNVAKSTVSIWCRDLELTLPQKKALHRKMVAAGHAGRLAGAATMREQKRVRLANAGLQAKKLLSSLTKRDRFMMGLGLYWGEGVKTDQSTTAFVNADPDSVAFMKEWFSDFFGVTKERFNPYIFIATTHKDREQVIKRFWSKQLSLPVKQFAHVVYLKQGHKKQYNSRTSYHGTLALRIRSSTNIKNIILAALSLLKEGKI